MNPLVIDLSHWNPTPDWGALKTAGTIGVIHKATEGNEYVDPCLYDRAAEASNAGLLWATYHFMRPGDMLAQMEWYLGVVDPVVGERMVLDHEDPGVSLDDLEMACAHIFTLRPDIQLTIYSGHLIKDQLGNEKNDFLRSNTSLWLAQYSTVPSWPSQVWPDWSLWQYTDCEYVTGVDKPVDANQWNGDIDGLIAWMSPTSSQPPAVTAPPPLPTIVLKEQVLSTLKAGGHEVTVRYEPETDTLEVWVDGVQASWG